MKILALSLPSPRRWWPVAAIIAGWMALPPAGQCAPALFADKEIIIPIEESTRPGGIVPLGYTTVELQSGVGLVRGRNDRGPVAFVRWFPNHLPLQVEAISDPALRLSVMVKGQENGAVKASWRLVGENAGMGPEVEGKLEPRGDGSSVALLPVPTVPAGKALNALSLTFPDAKSMVVIRAALVLPADMLIKIQPSVQPWKSLPLEVSGAGGTPGSALTLTIQSATDPRSPITVNVAADNDGNFTTRLDPKLLVGGDYTAQVRDQKSGKKSATVPFFFFPSLEAQGPPPIQVEGGRLLRAGKPFAFAGVNYTQFDLKLAREPDFPGIVRDVLEMHRWGIQAVRIPIDFGFIQPEEGVFPDQMRWTEVLRAHNISPQFMDQVDYFVRLAGQFGIYSLIDWHGFPTEPYNYHAGGQPGDEKAGKPGTAIAWLAPSPTKTIAFDPSNPRHRHALLTTDVWLARHFKGNTNILGFEIPYNEPHESFMAVEANWRELTNLAAAAVQSGDPDRITFTMPAAYGHDNLSPSATWLPPDRSSGITPHFYLANGPVPLRPDAQTMHKPYLAHDVAATFARAQASVFLPFSAVQQPIYNGEMGEYGNDVFLPGEKFPDRAEPIIEAQLVTAYGAGMNGALGWTLWNHPTEFVPYNEIYARVYQRFSPVFGAGPVDRSSAEVAFVQSPGAVPPNNGMNYACVPLAELALALHLPHVHYFTDQQFLYTFRASVPTGIEQVEEGVLLNRYKAIIVDRRNLDARATNLAQISKIPILWTDDAAKLTSQELAAFLTKSGVKVDDRTPANLQVIEGPGHLLLYNRADQECNARAYPEVSRKGAFRLVDESGKEVFHGDANALAQQGVAVALPRWRTTILRFEN